MLDDVNLEDVKYIGEVYYETPRQGPCKEVKSVIQYPMMPDAIFEDMVEEAYEVMEDYVTDTDDSYRVKFIDNDEDRVIMDVYLENEAWHRVEDGILIKKSKNYEDIFEEHEMPF